jgi:adenylate cyclase
VAQQKVERRLAAILAADVAGYSRLIGLDEEGTIARLRALQRELIDPTVAVHRGRVVKTTGDGVLIEFGSVVDAVRCAVEVQRGMASRNNDVPADKRIEFRIGINLGDVVVEGDDLLGDGVNVAARLEALAAPGGVCLSEDVYRHVARNVDVQFVDLGHQSLKNIRQSVRVYSVATDTDSVTPFDEPSAPPLSFLVLPFTNLSDNRDDEFFADGLTDDLTSDLALGRESFVIARSTAFTYKCQVVDVKAVRRDLRVRYVVEGSVRRSNNRVRVGVQLIETENGGHIWADRFDRDVGELLELQDEIIGRIALALHYKLLEVEIRRARDRRSNNPDARDLQFRGLAALYKPPSKETLAEARGYFERALELDGRSATAWAGLSLTHSGDLLGRWGDAPLKQLQSAEAAATRALACDPKNANAHHAKAAVLFVQTKLEAALEEYKTVADLHPGWPNAYGRMGILNALLGRPERTLHLVEKAIRLSPRDGAIGEWYLYIGIAEFMMDHLEEAIPWLRRAIAANPELGAGYYTLASVYSLVGRDSEARATLLEHPRRHPTTSIKSLQNLSYSNVPSYLAWRERFYDGLRKVGVPEE